MPTPAKRSSGNGAPSFFNEGELARTSFVIFKARAQRFASVITLGHRWQAWIIMARAKSRASRILFSAMPFWKWTLKAQ